MTVMTKFFKITTRDNRKKDFTQVDTSTSRGMGRHGKPGGTAGASGPRAGRKSFFVTWNGITAFWNNRITTWS